MTILVTGGAGFIGSAVSKALIDRGNRVVILDNFNDYYEVQLKEDRIKLFLKGYDVTLYRGDIRDKELVEKIFTTEKIDKVVHLAARAGVRSSLEDPVLYMDVNVVGTTILLDAATKHNCQNFVYASSSSVYGNNKKIPFSESDSVDSPISPYAASKKASELIAHAYSAVYKLPTTGLRFFTVYGPWGRPDMALFLFANGIFHDKPIDVYNNGEMARNFTYIDDIVSGVLVALDANCAYDVINIGGDRCEKLMDFIVALEKASGKVAQKNFLPMQKGDIVATIADISKLRAMGWAPTTRITEGVEKFVAWYRSYYNV